MSNNGIAGETFIRDAFVGLTADDVLELPSQSDLNGFKEDTLPTLIFATLVVATKLYFIGSKISEDEQESILNEVMSITTFGEARVFMAKYYETFNS